MPPTPALQVMISRETSSETDVSIIEKKKIDNFSWSVQLSTIEMTSEVQNLQLACGSWFHLTFEHFDIISVIDKRIDRRKLLSSCYSPYKGHCHHALNDQAVPW